MDSFYSIMQLPGMTFFDEVGEFVQSEMDILQMSQADNDKQEIDLIISTVASFFLGYCCRSFENC
jgi:hypothetical protein